MRRATSLVLALAIALAPAACVFDEKLKHDLGVVPEKLADGWEIATPESVGLSSGALANIHAVLLREDRFQGSLGMLVVKDGKLVWETYLRRAGDRDSYHHIQSATKSVTSIAFGIARDRGLFPSLDETAADLFPEAIRGLDPRKRGISLRHLLTMSSGLTFDNDDFSVEMWTDAPDDPLRYILAKPLYADPGREFRYRDADPQLVGYALQRRAGVSERALVASAVLSPLGITDYYWESGPDGVTLAAHGLHLRPRDLAKIGQLVLDEGAWQGRQLVSREWTRLMTSAHTTSTSLDAQGNLFGYGYYWWVFPGGVAAWGHGGQYVVIVPDERMVLVHFALPDTHDLDGSTLGEYLALVAPLL